MKMSEAKYKKVAQAILKVGGMPIPISDTFLEIIKMLLGDDEEEIDMVLAFKRKASQSLDQLKQTTGLSEEKILDLTDRIAKKEFIFNQPSSTGVKVFRLLTIVNVGLLEYTFMKELEVTERNKKLAELFTTLFKGLDDMIQDGYDNIMPSLLKAPAVDRTIPLYVNEPTGKEILITVNKDIDVPTEKIIPSQKIEEVVNKFDEIAVGHCFCRHHKDLEGEPCKQTDVRENCFTLGKSARHTVQQGFARMVSKDEAIKILKSAADDGLVMKVYHPNFDTSKPETSICNCCKCCCGNSLQNAMAPMINATHHLSYFDHELCVGCETCVDKCVNEAIYMNDDGKADRKAEKCIGCGVCAHFCPENAISLMSGKRIVKVPPLRKK